MEQWHGGQREHLSREKQFGPLLLAHVMQLDSNLVNFLIDLVQCFRDHVLTQEEGLFQHAGHWRVGLEKVLKPL